MQFKLTENNTKQTTPVNKTMNADLITLNMSIPLSPVNINNCCYDIDAFPEISTHDEEPRTRSSHVDKIGSINAVIGTFHPQYVGTTIHFREPVYNDDTDFIIPLKMPENTDDDNDDDTDSHDSCSKLELVREQRSYFHHHDDYESSYKTMDPLFEMLFKPLDHPDFQPTPELERFDALLEKNAHIELEPYSELDPYSMIFNPDVYLENEYLECSTHNLYTCECCNDADWEKAREADFSMLRGNLRKTRAKKSTFDTYLCDCETCATWNTEELDNFNRNNEMGHTITSIHEYEKLQIFSKKTQLSLLDGVCYSTYCHYCCQDMYEKRYDSLYCCDECEKAVEVKCEQCIYSCEDLKRHVFNLHMSGIGNNLKQTTPVVVREAPHRGPTTVGFKYLPVYSETLCKICDYKNDDTFNIRYGVNYNNEDIETTIKYAKEHDLTLFEAMDYLSACHYCGRDTPYAYGYCKSRCQDLAEDFNYECYRGKDCKVCNNYAICCAKIGIPY